MDPALYEGICFFETLLESHLGPRWRAELRELAERGESSVWNSTDGYGLGDSTDGAFPAQSITIDPVAYFQERQWKFPLLALYRDKGTVEGRTVHWFRERSTWKLDLILPPLSPMQAEALTPILKASLGVIVHFTEQGYDPDYQSNRLVWSEGRIESIRVTDYLMSNFRIQDGSQTGATINFPALTLSFEVNERSLDPDGAGAYEPLTGIDGYVSGDGYGGLADFQNNDLDQ